MDADEDKFTEFAAAQWENSQKNSYLKRLIEADKQKDWYNERIPTFEKSSKSSYTGFDISIPSLVINVNGDDFLFHISRATFGWRVADDYIIGVYQAVDGKLSPVAGFRVESAGQILEDFDFVKY